MDSPAPRAPASSGDKPSFIQKWKGRIQRDPLVYGFLGLTVVALTRGLGALMSNDHALSQRMMRMRVMAQLCVVGALAGGIYYRAATAEEGQSPFRQPEGAGRVRVDNRVYLRDSRAWDAAEAAARSGARDVATSPAIGPIPTPVVPGPVAETQEALQ